MPLPPEQTPAQRAAAPAARTSSRRRDGGKRADIVARAIEHFGQEGYENTKWADVAASVGIGSTALYHYFESKLHCLYVIMGDTLESFHDDFTRITSEHEDFLDALGA